MCQISLAPGQRTISGLIEAVIGIAVGGEDDDVVALRLQTDGGIDDEPLGTSNAQVRVKEDDVLRHERGGEQGRGVRCTLCRPWLRP